MTCVICACGRSYSHIGELHKRVYLLLVHCTYVLPEWNDSCMKGVSDAPVRGAKSHPPTDNKLFLISLLAASSLLLPLGLLLFSSTTSNSVTPGNRRTSHSFLFGIKNPRCLDYKCTGENSSN